MLSPIRPSLPTHSFPVISTFSPLPASVTHFFPSYRFTHPLTSLIIFLWFTLLISSSFSLATPSDSTFPCLSATVYLPLFPPLPTPSSSGGVIITRGEIESRNSSRLPTLPPGTFLKAETNEGDSRVGPGYQRCFGPLRS